MFIKVKVLPNSKEEEIRKTPEDRFEVKVKEKPEKGLANKRTLEILSSYFHLPPASIKLVKGNRQRNKIFEIRQIERG